MQDDVLELFRVSAELRPMSPGLAISTNLVLSPPDGTPGCVMGAVPQEAKPFLAAKRAG